MTTTPSRTLQRKKERDRLLNWYKRIKRHSRCSICGSPGHTEFHHVVPRNGGLTVHGLVRNRSRPETIWAEMGKCIPVCPRCHHAIHEARGW